MKTLSILIVTFLFGTSALQAQPVASFTSSTNEVCGGFFSGTGSVGFTSTSTGNIINHMWDFGNSMSTSYGNSSAGANYGGNIEGPTYYDVCLTVTDDQGLQDTHCEEDFILVYPSNDFSEGVYYADTLCVGESIEVNGNIYDETQQSGSETFENFYGCDSVVYIQLVFVDELAMTGAVVENVPCGQSTGGVISFDVSCETEPLIYSWTPSMPGTENVATDLAGGTYSVTITDVNNNSTSGSFVVLAPAAPIEIIETTVTDPGSFCYYGSACVHIEWTGGNPPFTVQRVGGGFNLTSFDHDLDFCGLSAGTHQFKIIDNNGCEVVSQNPITIMGSPSPDWVYVPNWGGEACLGDDLAVEAISPNTVSYLWSSSDFDFDCPTCQTTDIQDLNLGWNFYNLEIENSYGCILVLDSIPLFVNDDCDPVWPGDTDTNQVVNNFDLLNIGLAYDATGPIRPNATLDWMAQEADAWLLSNPNGSNYKHSDTDGNGVVNANDTLAITLNWGEEHNFAGGSPNNLMPVYPLALATSITMPFYVEPDTFTEGEMLSIPVILGEMGAEAENVYGVAFTLEFDPTIIVPGSAYLGFEDSWIGNINDDMIDVQKTFHSEGRIDVCLTRTDHTSVTGFGQLGELFITIEDDILFQSGGSGNLVTTDDGETVFNITNVLILNSDGEQLEVNPSETTSVILDTSTAIKNINETNLIQIYPNPANNNLTVMTQNLMIESIQLFSLDGVLLKSTSPDAEQYFMDTKILHDGIYIIRIHTLKGVMNKRITILH